MAKRYFNWKLLIVFIFTILLIAGTVIGLRKWQRSQRAGTSITPGVEAYEKGDWNNAANYLGQYLAVNNEDVDVLLKYAEAQQKRTPSSNANIIQAIQTYRNVLRIALATPEQKIEAAIGVSRINIAVGQAGEAELIASRELKVTEDPELRLLYAQALLQQRKFSEAYLNLKKLIETNPDKVLAYVNLAVLAETKPDIVDRTSEDYINLCVEKNSENADAYIAKVRFQLSKGMADEAESNLQRASEILDSVPDVDALIDLAQTYVILSKYDEAELIYHKIKDIELSSARLWQDWASMSLKQGDKEKMQQVADEGLDALKYSPWNFVPRAIELYIESGQIDKAKVQIKNLSQKDMMPQLVEAFEGFIAVKAHEDFQAIKHLKKAVEFGDINSRFKLMLAQAYRRVGDNQSAEILLQNIISNSSDNTEASLMLSQIYASRGETQKASDLADAILQKNNSAQALLLKLRAKIQGLSSLSDIQKQLQYDQLREEVDMLIKNNPDITELTLLSAQLEVQNGNLKEASSLVDKLLAEKDGDMRIYIAKVQILMMQNKDTDAVDLLVKMVDESPQSFEAVRLTASVLNNFQMYIECERLVNEAIARFENPSDIRSAQLLNADLLLSWDKPADAIEVYNRIIAQYPEDLIVVRRLLAIDSVRNNLNQANSLINKIREIEGESGWQWRYEQAMLWYSNDDLFEQNKEVIITTLQEAIKINAEDVPSQVLLSRCYHRLDNTQMALSVLRQALDKWPSDVRVVVPMVSLLNQVREFDKVDEIMARARIEQSSDPLISRLSLQGYLRQGKLETASEMLDNMLKENPEDINAAIILSRIKTTQQEYGAAEKILRSIYKVNPNSPVIARQMVELALIQKDNDAAIKICNEHIKNVNTADAFILRARTSATLEDFESTLKDLDKAIEISPDDSMVWRYVAIFNFEQGNQKRAIEAINKALELDSESIEVVKVALELYSKTGTKENLDKAAILLETALKVAPEDNDLLRNKASVLISKGTAPSLTEAKSILNSVVSSNPSSIQAWLMLGSLLMQEGDYNLAHDTALKALSQNPDNRDLLILKASAESIQSPGSAAYTYQVLYNQNPNDFNMASRLASAYITAKQYDRALEIIGKMKKLAEDDQQKSRSSLLEISAFYNKGENAKALDVYNEKISETPADSILVLGMFSLLLEDEQYDKALIEINNWIAKSDKESSDVVLLAAQSLQAKSSKIAISTSISLLENAKLAFPEDTSILAMLANAYQLSDQVSKAINLYQKILSVKSDNVVVMNNLAWALATQGKDAEALEIAEKGIAISPDYVDLIDTAGFIYLNLKQYDNAEKMFKRCLELYTINNPARSGSLYHLGMTYARMGKKNLAADTLKTALALNDENGGLTDVDRKDALKLLNNL